MAERGSRRRVSNKPRRSGAACHYCHSRKIRCDVEQHGVPCSNCEDHRSGACTIRRRKNARETLDNDLQRQHSHDTNVLHQQSHNSAIQPQQAPHPSVYDRQLDAGHVVQQQPHGNIWSNDLQTNSSPEAVIQAQTLPQPQPQQQFAFDGGDQSLGWSPWNASSSIDFSNLTDLEEIFAFTDWASLPVPDGFPPTHHVVPALPDELAFTWNPPADAAAHHYLQSQACFEVPPTPILRQIMRYYFQFIHPNLPIVEEYRFESLWAQEDYRLEGFSFVVLRAMLFTAVHFLDADSLSILGFASTREARLVYYKRAKMIFDFDGETDPIACAQACLLLTYYAPPHNKLRINGYWFMNAARFARIAGAHTFHLKRDPVTAKLLKRLWWGVIFRDRILSLGLRWSPQVELDPVFENEAYFLSSEDFASDLGKSIIHDLPTQLRIASIATATCGLVSKLTPVLKVLYRHESVLKRVASVGDSVEGTISEVRRCLDSLQQWHERYIRVFPVPISLDDTHESVCIYANLLFCYYASAVFALHFFCILIHETLPRSRDLVSLEACQEGSVLAINDIDRRTQELVQTRLTRYLPISVSAFMALPLLLQAINVAAVRGTEAEALETRKLDIFTRILENQRQNFDGADFCVEILSNIVAYLQDDDKFIEWIATRRDGRDQSSAAATPNGGFGSASKQRERVKLNWTSLIRRQPRLYLRLLLHLDFCLCHGSVLKEGDLPIELLRNGGREH